MKRTLFVIVSFVLLLGSASAQQDCQMYIRNAAADFFEASVAVQTAVGPAKVEKEQDRNAKLSLFLDNFRLPAQPQCIMVGIQSAPVETSSRSTLDWKSLSAEATAIAKASFQQNTASAGGGGTTNAVSGPITSQLLSLAQTYGGITESTSGQNTTLSGNLFNLSLLLINAGLQPCKDYNEFVKATKSPTTCLPVGSLTGLNRVSFALSFPATQSSTTPVSAAGSSSSTPSSLTNLSQLKSLNQVKVTGVILRGKAASADTLAKAFADPNSVPDVTGVRQRLNQMRTQLQYDDDCVTEDATGICKWVWDEEQAIVKAEKRLSGSNPPSPDDLADEYSNKHDFSLELPQYLSPEALSQDVSLANKYLAAAALYRGKLSSMVEGLRSTVLSAEYDANFPASQPSNSVFRVIAAPSFPGITLTLNGAASWYNGNPSSVVPGSRLLRDFQLAGEIAHTFNSSSKVAKGKDNRRDQQNGLPARPEYYLCGLLLSGSNRALNPERHARTTGFGSGVPRPAIRGRPGIRPAWSHQSRRKASSPLSRAEVGSIFPLLLPGRTARTLSLSHRGEARSESVTISVRSLARLRPTKHALVRDARCAPYWLRQK